MDFSKVGWPRGMVILTPIIIYAVSITAIQFTDSDTLIGQITLLTLLGSIGLLCINLTFLELIDRGWTPLEILNRLILQWLFIRLTRHTDKHITHFAITEVSICIPYGGPDIHGDVIMPGAFGNSTDKAKFDIGVGGKIEGYSITRWWSIQYFIVPMTGWKNNMRYLTNGAKFLRITKKRQHI